MRGSSGCLLGVIPILIASFFVHYVSFQVLAVFLMANSPGGSGPPLRVSSITLRHTTLGRTPLKDGSGRRTCQNTAFTTDRNPCPRWYSKPQSQQAIGRRPTPYTARPMRSALCICNIFNADKERNHIVGGFRMVLWVIYVRDVHCKNFAQIWWFLCTAPRE